MAKFSSAVAFFLVLQLIAVSRVYCASRTAATSFIEAESKQQPQANPLVEGIIQVDGRPFRAVCNCNSEGMTPAQAEFLKNASFCSLSKVLITPTHMDKRGGGLNAGGVREAYGQPVDVTYVHVAKHHFSCMDDRIAEETLSTPGGDLGEFLLAVSVADSFSKSVQHDESSLTALLEKYLDTIPSYRKFNYCTEDRAVSHLEKSLNVEGLDLNNPAPPLQDDIKSALETAENVGDTHFRLMMKYPASYEVKPELPGLVQKAFFNILWNKDSPNRQKLTLDVLPGKRSPKAILEVVTSQECKQADMAPLLHPKWRGVQAIIYDSSAVENRRKELANFMVKNQGVAATVEDFMARMDRRGAQGQTTTATRIGGDSLPYFKVSYV